MKNEIKAEAYDKAFAEQEKLYAENKELIERQEDYIDSNEEIIRLQREELEVLEQKSGLSLDEMRESAEKKKIEQNRISLLEKFVSQPTIKPLWEKFCQRLGIEKEKTH